LLRVHDGQSVVYFFSTVGGEGVGWTDVVLDRLQGGGYATRSQDYGVGISLHGSVWCALAEITIHCEMLKAATLLHEWVVLFTMRLITRMAD